MAQRSKFRFPSPKAARRTFENKTITIGVGRSPRKEGFAFSRNNVVRSGLKPILRKLGIPDENVGLHAFRHGLATELAESEPITVLQAQMRHADVRTTLKVVWMVAALS